MKYIDSEKLIAEIERRIDLICTTEGVVQRDKLQEYEALRDVEDFITSFQQEQPLTIEKVVAQCKKFGGNPKVIQPEVDLEKEIAQTYRDGSVADTSNMDHIDYENIARHFYELALADVKIEIERNKDKTDSRYNNLHSPANPQDIDEKQLEKIRANLVAKRSFLSGEINGYDKILDFIDNLTK